MQLIDNIEPILAEILGEFLFKHFIEAETGTTCLVGIFLAEMALKCDNSKPKNLLPY